MGKIRFTAQDGSESIDLTDAFVVLATGKPGEGIHLFMDGPVGALAMLGGGLIAGLRAQGLLEAAMALSLRAPYDRVAREATVREVGPEHQPGGTGPVDPTLH